VTAAHCRGACSLSVPLQASAAPSRSLGHFLACSPNKPPSELLACPPYSPNACPHPKAVIPAARWRACAGPAGHHPLRQGHKEAWRAAARQKGARRPGPARPNPARPKASARLWKASQGPTSVSPPWAPLPHRLCPAARGAACACRVTEPPLLQRRPSPNEHVSAMPPRGSVPGCPARRRHVCPPARQEHPAARRAPAAAPSNAVPAGFRPCWGRRGQGIDPGSRLGRGAAVATIFAPMCAPLRGIQGAHPQSIRMDCSSAIISTRNRSPTFVRSAEKDLNRV
jgi:hypothetical protein